VRSIDELLTIDPSWHNKLRELAQYPDWYVPVMADSRAVLWTIDGVCHWTAQSDRSLPAEGEYQWLEMRGRHLLSVLPEEMQRLLFDWGKPNSVLIEGERLELLRNIAASLDCEDAINTPGLEGGVDAALAHSWLVLCEHDLPSVIQHKGLDTICAFTAVDALARFIELEPDNRHLMVRSINGAQLFAELDARSDWDCLWVNPHRELECAPLAPESVYELTQHREPRAEGKILKARTVAEIHHFLDERGMLQDERQHSMVYVGDELVAQYSGTKAFGESISFDFYPVSESGSILDWGSGATEILCTGKLADVLRRRLALIEELPLPLSESDSQYVRVAVLWARELEKTLNDDQSELSRRTQRTADGARFIREFPWIKKRDFMKEAIKFCDGVLSA